MGSIAKRHSLLLTSAIIALALAVAWPRVGRSVIENLGLTDIDRAAVAAARVRPRLERELAEQHLRWGAPAFLRVFKREAEMELWLQGNDGRYALFKRYPVCTYSGTLGPKRKQGDNQAPEGFYRVARGQLNPRSQFHLAFNLGYPNAFDRAHGYTGDFLMVHGNCVSIGCYAMGDAAIEEIYSLVAAALESGQEAVDVHALPFRLESAALQTERASPWFDFWSQLKAGYDAFERTHRPPHIGVANLSYRVTEG